MTPFSDEEMEIIHEMRQILRSWGETLQKKIDTPPTPVLLPRMMVPEPKGGTIREPDRGFLGQRDYYGICDHCMMPECDCEMSILQKSFSSKHPPALVETKMEETIRTKQERVRNPLQQTNRDKSWVESRNRRIEILIIDVANEIPPKSSEPDSTILQLEPLHSQQPHIRTVPEPRRQHPGSTPRGSDRTMGARSDFPHDPGLEPILLMPIPVPSPAPPALVYQTKGIGCTQQVPFPCLLKPMASIPTPCQKSDCERKGKPPELSPTLPPFSCLQTRGIGSEGAPADPARGFQKPRLFGRDLRGDVFYIPDRDPTPLRLMGPNLKTVIPRDSVYAPFETPPSVQCPPPTSALSTIPPPASMMLVSDLRLAILHHPQRALLTPTQPVSVRTGSVHNHKKASRIHFDARIWVLGPDGARFHEPIRKPPDPQPLGLETKWGRRYLGSTGHDPPDPTLDGLKYFGPRPKLYSLYQVVRLSSDPIRVSPSALDVPDGKNCGLPLSKSPTEASTSIPGNMIRTFMEAVFLVPVPLLGLASPMRSDMPKTSGFMELHLSPCERSKRNQGLDSLLNLCDTDFRRSVPDGTQRRQLGSLGDHEWRPRDAGSERLLLTSHGLKHGGGATIARKGTRSSEGIRIGVTLSVDVRIGVMPVEGTDSGLVLVGKRESCGPKGLGVLGFGGGAFSGVTETGRNARFPAERIGVVKLSAASPITVKRRGPKAITIPFGFEYMNSDQNLGPEYGNGVNGLGYWGFNNNFGPLRRDFGLGFLQNKPKVGHRDCNVCVGMGHFDFGVPVDKCEKHEKLDLQQRFCDDAGHKEFADSFLEGNVSHMVRLDLHVRAHVEPPKGFAHTVKRVHKLDGRTPISNQSPISNSAATVTKLSSQRINVPCLVGDELSLYSMTRFAHPYLVFLMFIPCALVGQMISMAVGTHFPLSQDVPVLHISWLTGCFLAFVLSASMLLAWILFCFMVKTSGHKSIRTTMVYVISQIPFLAHSVHFSGFVVQCLVSDLVSPLKMKHMGQQEVETWIVGSTIDDFTLMNLVHVSIRMALSGMGNMLEPTQGNLFVKEEILIGLHLEDKVVLLGGSIDRPLS